MLSLGAQMRPEVLHTFVDTFVEGKKAQVKLQLRQAMETVLDDLFGELLGQLKDMLLPALGVDRDRAGTDTGGGHQTAEAPKQTRPKSPKKTGPKLPPSRRPVNAVKSKPDTSAGGEKRPREPDTVSVDIEHFGDDPALSDEHQEAITVTKKARTKPDKSTAALDLDPQSNTDDDDSDLDPPLIIDEAPGKFVCSSPGCGKRFNRSDVLKEHERLHSGPTTFSCKFPECSQTGNKRFNILRHIRRVHLKNLEPGQEDDPEKYLEKLPK